jgi:hypothetical protein
LGLSIRNAELVRTAELRRNVDEASQGDAAAGGINGTIPA